MPSAPLLGVPLMDRDHAALDRLFDAAATTADSELPALLDTIAQELHDHFAREEAASSIGSPPTPQEVDDLLQRRMKILGLDVDAIGRDFREVFDKVRKNCPRCGDREACVIDLRHDPNALIWEAYCPNSAVLNALVALTEAGAPL